MTAFLLRITGYFIPETPHQPPMRQAGNILNVAGFWIALPVAAGGLAWLWNVSDWGLLLQQWKLVLILGALMILFNRLPYFIVAETGGGRYVDLSGSLDEVAVWTGVFLLGPNALWLGVIQVLGFFLYRYYQVRVAYIRWGALRNAVFNLVFFTSLPLAGLLLYRRLGGIHPLPILTLLTVIQGLSTLAAKTLLEFGWWMLFFHASRWVRSNLGEEKMDERISILFFLFLPSLALPFSTFGAGLYSHNGPWVFLFFAVGLVVVSVLVNRLSVSAERNRLQSHQIEQLEKIGRAFLEISPAAGNIIEILRRFVPPMFAFANLEIRLFPDEVVYCSPEGYQTPQGAWDWLREHTREGQFDHKRQLAWDPPMDEKGWILMPILDNRERKQIGGIYYGGFLFAVNANQNALAHQIPALQSLAAAVSSALQQVQVYQEQLAYESAHRELLLAGEMQNSFLPCKLPEMDGWQMVAALKSALGASGDFYDFFPLADGRVALFIADVTDKGVSAALYMAICRTLIRTYTPLMPSKPDEVLNTVNWRILDDTCSNEFVTVFLGVLDLTSCELTYASAGHNPPMIANSGSLIELTRTGIPLGIDETACWGSQVATLNEGDMIVLYTDGVIDCINEREERFGEERLRDFVTTHNSLNAADFQQGLLDELEGFSNGVKQFDDITLIILKKDELSKAPEGIPPEAPGYQT